MSPRRSAFFDIGTNTILCVIAELRDTGRFRVLDDLAEIARLGEGVDQSGVIGTAGEARALEILRRYRERCESLGVDEYVAVGTSALRDARNSAEVRGRWRDQLGIDVRVIAGAEEAAYSFLAVQRGLMLPGRELLVIDIGGGSTEFIRGNQQGVTRALSVDVGSVRLTEKYLRSDPVRPAEVEATLAEIEWELDQVPPSFGGEDLTLVGIAGTFTTLAAIEKKLARYSHVEVHGCTLPLAEVRRQRQLLQERTIAERKMIVGLEPKRADVIFAGTCLAEKIMVRFGAERIVVSDQGVRYGLLHEAAKAI